MPTLACWEILSLPATFRAISKRDCVNYSPNLSQRCRGAGSRVTLPEGEPLRIDHEKAWNRVSGICRGPVRAERREQLRQVVDAGKRCDCGGSRRSQGPFGERRSARAPGLGTAAYARADACPSLSSGDLPAIFPAHGGAYRGWENAGRRKTSGWVHAVAANRPGSLSGEHRRQTAAGDSRGIEDG